VCVYTGANVWVCVCVCVLVCGNKNLGADVITTWGGTGLSALVEQPKALI